MGISKITRINKHSQLGLWKIEESTDELLKMLALTPMESDLLSRITHPQRKKQWLAYRVLIKKMLNITKALDINYDVSGTPRILNHFTYVSVTHSGPFSAAILHKKYQAGIDLEEITPRIIRVKEKFLSPEELRSPDTARDPEQLTAYWCAKEAIFKARTCHISSLKEQIYIHPFDVKTLPVVQGMIKEKEKEQIFYLALEKTDNYLMAYTIDAPSGGSL